MDVELGISHCGGLATDYLKVLEITYQYGEKHLKELEGLWERKDYKGYNIKVHSLKSTSLNIGAKDVSAEAKRQEEAGLKEDYEYIDKNINQLIEKYMIILQKIKKVLVHYEMISLEEAEKPKMEERMIIHTLRNVQKYVEDFDFSKVFEVIEEVKNYELPSQYEETIKQLEVFMEDLSIDEIKELLSHAIPKEES